MSGRWSLFKRFLIGSPKARDLRSFQFRYSKLITWQDPAVSDEAEGPSQSPTIDFTDTVALKPINNGVLHPTGFESIESTGSQRLFDNLLTTYYVPLEVWYTRTIIEKARLPKSRAMGTNAEPLILRRTVSQVLTSLNLLLQPQLQMMSSTSSNLSCHGLCPQAP
jgi:hypothetical protein